MAGTALAMMLVPLVSDMFMKRKKSFYEKKKSFIIRNLFMQLIHMLLDIYGFRGTTLIVGGWALHSVVGSCLLRPFKEQPPAQPVVEVIILQNNGSLHSSEFLT